MKKFHKYAGIIALIWLIGMGVSGILLNHPDLIKNVSFSRSSIPGDYKYQNWNRASFRGTLDLEATTLVYGEGGIWEYRDKSTPPSDYNAGLPQSAYERDTRAVTLDPKTKTLYAGLRGGLYERKAATGEPWREVALLGNDEPLVDVILTPEGILALTRSNVYMNKGAGFELATPGKVEESQDLSLFRVIFEMHGGKTWGLPGKLVIDFSGVVLVFLCLTGVYFWWKKRAKTLKEGTSRKIARKGLKYHVKLGLYLSPLLLFVGLTGIFQRPPFLIFISGTGLPQYLYPAKLDPNPWHDKLRKAAYLEERQKILLSTADGVYEADAANFGPSTTMKPSRRQPPISVMGATVFRPAYSSEREREVMLVGSMSGYYLWDLTKRDYLDFYTGQEPQAGGGMPVGEHKTSGMGLITGKGAFQGDSGFLVADYDTGLSFCTQTGNCAPATLLPPVEFADGGKISLWHTLFEFHNGRLFGFLLGWWSWIVIPLGGLVYLIEIISGLKMRLKK